MRQPTVSIAVRPGAKIVVPEEAQRVVRNELMVKYLESIGATPSKANLATLKKNIPPELIHFSTAWKSNLAGEPDCVKVYFEAPPHHTSQASASRADARGAVAGHAAAMSENAVQELSSVLDKTVLEAKQAASQRTDAIGKGNRSYMSFEEARRSYLYPFKGKGALRPPEQTVSPGLGQKQRVGSFDDDDDDEKPAPRKYISRDPLLYQPYTEEDVEAELAEDLHLHTKEIVALQAQFIQRFPFERLKDKLNADELRITMSEITSRRTARFIGMLMLFLYWYHIAFKGGKKPVEKQLSTLLCAVQQYFSSVRDRMRPRRALLMNALPVLLLSVRMTIEGLVHVAFPKWWSTTDGAQTLQRMDEMVEELFDPNAYHSHITALESTSEAIRISAKEGLGLKRRSRTARFLTTSTMVSTSLPKAPLVAARRHIAGSSLPAINSVLTQLATADVKHQLYQSAIGAMHVEAQCSDMVMRPKANEDGARSLRAACTNKEFGPNLNPPDLFSPQQARCKM